MEDFTSHHMIKLVHEDKHKKQAIFVTQSMHSSRGNAVFFGDSLIDSVTVLKLVVGGDNNLI